MLRTSLFISILLVTIGLHAQKPFEGKITYNISYEDMTEDMEGLERMLPQELSMVIKGKTSRAEQVSVFGGKQTFINREGEDSTVVLVDILERKLKYVIPQDKRKEERFKVIEKEETKEIKGIKCKKAILQSANGIVLEVWYAPEFENPAGSEYPQLKGLPMEYEISQRGMTLSFKVKSISQEPIDETYFVIPDDYEETSLERINQMIRQ